MAITYSIDGGADAAKFIIDSATGKLAFKAVPDYEVPGDANGDNVYEVTVKATDPQNLSTTQDMRITVTNMPEGQPPQITSVAATSVPENTTDVITVTAIDPDAGGGTPPATGTIPITFNDPIFTGMTERTSTMTLSNGQNLVKTSIKEQSGNPSITSNGNNTIDLCRVLSRECVRITDDDLTVTNGYYEAKGSGSDHADTFQAYSPGARGGTVTLRNTHVRAYNQAATAGMFVADNWGGTCIFKDVIFQGGPYGLRLISDPTCHIDVDLENVFFVGPFGYNKFAFQEYNGGTMTIRKWVNVRDATIVDGVLVPGAQIPKPTSVELEKINYLAPPRPVRKQTK